MSIPVTDLKGQYLKPQDFSPNDYYVRIDTLKNYNDGGILDPDDQLCDVADDREQIIAMYEEQSAPSVPHNGGDGTSASSVGTASPDIFQAGDGHPHPQGHHPHHPPGHHNDKTYDHILRRHSGRNDVVITSNDLTTATGLTVLQVRRSSDPNLTNIGNEITQNEKTKEPIPPMANKRWSAVVTMDTNHPPRGGSLDSTGSPIQQKKLSANHRGSPLLNHRGSPQFNHRGSPRNQRRSDHQRQSSKQEADRSDDENLPKRIGGNGQEKSAFTRFARDSGRQSLGGGHPAIFKWMEAQEKTEEQYQKKAPDGRKEPLGGSGVGHQDEPKSMSRGIDVGQDDDHSDGHSDSSNPHDTSGDTDNGERREEMIVLKNEGGPLGIHVVPDYDDYGRDMGLLIQGIEPGGRIHKDGRLRVQDKIIEINGNRLIDVNFSHAQEIFRQALNTPDIKLQIIRAESPPLPKQPPPTMPKPSWRRKQDEVLKENNVPIAEREKAIGDKLINGNNMSETNNTKYMDVPMNIEHQKGGGEEEGDITSPNKKTPPAVPQRSPSTHLTAPAPGVSVVPVERNILTGPTNTRKIGKKVHIQLTKGPQGLGFSITTRDNPAGGNCPIYIKNILPKGAAIQDGRLKPGDRLLEVNGIEMTGKTQAEAVSILRNTKLGSVVNLVVSRQEEEEQFAVPRQLESDSTNALQPAEKAAEEEIPAKGNKEILSFEIPLNETGSAGLGVSVKGKTSTDDQGNTRDLGIFIKAVIHGGAASKDGRLKINDQLVKVNGENLIGKTNTEAMDSLRRAMQKTDPVPGIINLVIARRIGAPLASGTSTPNTSGGDHRILHEREKSNTSEVFFNGPEAMEDFSSQPLKREDLKDTGEVRGDEPSEFKENNLDKAIDIQKIRNPVLDRITGGAGLRNQIPYGMAPSEHLNENRTSTGEHNHSPPNQSNSLQHQLNNSITLTGSSGEVIMIDDDQLTQVKLRPRAMPSPARPHSSIDFLNYPQPQRGSFRKQYEQARMKPSTSKERPHSTIGFNANAIAASHQPQGQGASTEGAPVPPEWLSQWQDHQNKDEEEDMSPMPDEGHDPFRREGFGRQSMSEKRKGHLDPTKSEIYQKAKMAREIRGMSGSQTLPLPTKHKRPASFQYADGGNNEDEDDYGDDDEEDNQINGARIVRAGSAESLLGHSNLSLHERIRFTGDVGGNKQDFGPTLGMKKSSSLESLQAMVEEVVKEEDGNYWNQGTGGVSRSRGCNESFRNAVDRSYEGQVGVVAETVPMEPLEEESSEGGSIRQSGGRDSFSSNSSDPMSVNRKKKKGGLFKGLGHMFRFGKHRKSLEDRMPKMSSAEMHRQRELEKQKQEQMERYKARIDAQQEQERIQEQYRKLQEKQRQMENQKAQQEQDMMSRMERQQRSMPANLPTTRAERIQQLRSEHQRRHRERHGQYPMEEQEETYERQIVEDEYRFPTDDVASGHLYSDMMLQLMTKSGHQGPVGGNGNGGANSYALPPRRKPDPRPQYDRPRYDYSDPQYYSHYANYNEIQEQLKKQDYYREKYMQYQRERQQQNHHHPGPADVQQNGRGFMHGPGQHKPQENNRDVYGHPHHKPPENNRGVYGHPQHKLDNNRESLYAQVNKNRDTGYNQGQRSSRSQTPTNNLGYSPHYAIKPQPQNLPNIVLNDNNFDYDDPRHAYTEHHGGYEAIPRRTLSQKQLEELAMSGSAQV
ncbi:partitioning defective 3 homolog [Lingula anatina]|uniref:Partitioning defective 3 homolog n=1 Tax=Lingula anatina TaxID=7574 RepID=A0A1S3IUA8_LINAN|nr:partitioning defective 3 homolog [Lingula anatina]|eukprot:XP_013401792.1 partitioning defective 3 homolog [Lingula anatina]